MVHKERQLQKKAARWTLPQTAVLKTQQLQFSSLFKMMELLT